MAKTNMQMTRRVAPRTRAKARALSRPAVSVIKVSLRMSYPDTMKSRELFDQLDWHWENQLRARLSGLGDDEYLWEPVPGCWSVRETSPGVFAADWAWPPPDPAPVTTIAWRLAHVTFSVLGFRANWHFGDRSLTWETAKLPGSASEALDALDRSYQAWRTGILGAPDDFFATRSEGPPGTLDAQFPFEGVVLHINREVIHHGAEIALLRDLYFRHNQEDSND